MILGGEIQRAFSFGGECMLQRPQGRVTLSYFADLDHDEIARRKEAGLGAITDRGVINALWEVPAGLEFPRDALPAWVIERIADLEPAGMGTTLRRQTRPPLTIRAAAAVGPYLSRLLDALGPLSSVCSMAAVLTRKPPPLNDPVLLDARIFGVAVGVERGNKIFVLNKPQPVRGDLGAYQWHMAELIYSEMIGAT